MKKLYVGTLLTLTLLGVQMASAQNACNLICQAYYPCDYPCDHCVGDPGLWEAGGGCWGDIVSGTCGDIGQCGHQPPPSCTPNWTYDQYAVDQGVTPVFEYKPCEDDPQYNPSTDQWEYVCDFNNPYKCSVRSVYLFERHQNNCSSSPSSQTFCEIDYTGSGWYVGRYSGYQDWACCNDANVWNCYTYFPQC